MSGSPRVRRSTLGVAAALVVGTMWLYAPVADFAFLKYDDPIYVLENPSLQAGLSFETIARAFAEPYETNWIPLTWISLQLDHAWFGFDPSGFHLMNAVLHAVTAGLLFIALTALTGAPAPSLFVAAVFAVHPIHVESVAWISERKDVLSGLFFAATLWAYAGYAQARAAGRRRAAGLRLAGVTALACGGLLAKPMLVTLPGVLLLLDHWPLGRTRPVRERLPGLLLEKAPLLAASLAVAWVTVRVQRAGGAVLDEPIPGWIRLGNALESTAHYVADSFWPVGLAVFYPHPGSAITPLVPASIALALLAVTAVCVRTLRTRPYLLVGWLWFGLMLLPVIGIVQAGMQARADRYLYLPQTGLAIAVAWSARDAWAHGPRGRSLCALLAVVSVVALGAATRQQLPHWRDTASLFRRALAVTDDNFVAHEALAAELLEAGDAAGAATHYREAVRLRPRWPEAHLGLGDALRAQGDLDGAIASYRAGVAAAPRRAGAHLRLGQALLDTGRAPESIEPMRQAVRLSGREPPRGVRARYAAALARTGDDAEAVRQLRAEVRAHPDFAEARANLGLALIRVGDFAGARDQLTRAVSDAGESASLHMGLATASDALGDASEAVEHYSRALALRPGWRAPANNLAWLLATHPDPDVRDPRRAIALLESLAITAEPAAAHLDTLAAAHAASGDFTRAMELSRSAAALARNAGRPDLAEAIERRRAGYAAGRPHVDARFRNASGSDADSSPESPEPPAPR